MGGIKGSSCMVIFVTVCLSLSLAEDSPLKRVASNENGLQKFFTDRFDWLPWINSEKSEKPPTSVYPILYNYNPSLHYGDTPANYFSPVNTPALGYGGQGIPQNLHFPAPAHLPLNIPNHPYSYFSGTNLLPILLVFKPSSLLENILIDKKPTSLLEGFSSIKPQITGQSGHLGQHPHQTPGISQIGQILQTGVASHVVSSVSSPIKGEDREPLKNEPEVSAQTPAKGNEDIDSSSYEDDKDIKIPFHYLYPLLAQTAVSQRNPIQKKLNDRMELVYLRDLREGKKMP
uniref:BESS domain-containing protein n=1 Tax=Glossina austeni TaxID=7395 RepID=A0A1A9UX72_GLOAU